VATSLLRPRPLPDRRLATVAGGLLVLLALPVFLVAGWRIEGWAFGAVLWIVSQLLGVFLNRAGIGEPTLRGSGIAAFGMMGRGIVLAVAAIAVAAADPGLAVAGALVYAAAYTLELALSLTVYFSGEAKR
jgi:hypothetical protein